MQSTLRHIAAASVLAACTQLAHAGVVQTLGAGSAVHGVTNAAHFTLDDPLVNDYVEDGLVFHYTGSAQNNFCGYAGADCYDDPSEISSAFAGNYIATAGTGAYLSVKRAGGGHVFGLEFAAGSLYANLNGYWQTFWQGHQTGSGNFGGGDGTVLGLYDLAGFDEVRYFAFAAANKQAGFSAPALDEVRADVPEPGVIALFLVGLAGLAGRRRRG